VFYEIDGRLPLMIGEGQFIAQDAQIIGSVQLHPNCNIWFCSVLRGDKDDLIVGENSNIQDGAVLHTETGLKLTVGRNCTIGHRVVLHGCTIGDNTLVGMGSVIMNRSVIGKNCIVGAGTVVPEGKTFPDGVLLLGNPAKVVRPLTEKELNFLDLSALNYVRNARSYIQKLRPINMPTYTETLSTVGMYKDGAIGRFPAQMG
jgi:carbonic anhydrase/acetyltransferase-like protein (isoleucine patch superfamily)